VSYYFWKVHDGLFSKSLFSGWKGKRIKGINGFSISLKCVKIHAPIMVRRWMMKAFRWSLILSLISIFFMMNSARGDTYSLYLRYKPAKEFPSLQEKIGPNLGLAPFKDGRSDTLYIGYHLSFFGSASYT